MKKKEPSSKGLERRVLTRACWAGNQSYIALYDPSQVPFINGRCSPRDMSVNSKNDLVQAVGSGLQHKKEK